MTEDSAKEIKELRSEIDAIDRQIQDLIEQRLAVAKKLGVIKRAAGLHIFDPKRETEVILRLADRASTIPNQTLVEVFSSIIRMCRTNQ